MFVFSFNCQSEKSCHIYLWRKSFLNPSNLHFWAGKVTCKVRFFSRLLLTAQMFYFRRWRRLLCKNFWVCWLCGGNRTWHLHKMLELRNHLPASPLTTFLSRSRVVLQAQWVLMVIWPNFASFNRICNGFRCIGFHVTCKESHSRVFSFFSRIVACVLISVGWLTTSSGAWRAQWWYDIAIASCMPGPFFEWWITKSLIYDAFLRTWLYNSGRIMRLKNPKI